MQATNSFRIQLNGIVVGKDELLGPEGAFEKQPFFGAGAIRFVAAQLGGTLALWDATRDHLLAFDRYENPHQAARLGQMVAELEGAHALVRNGYVRASAAIAWEQQPAEKVTDHFFADSARVAMEAAADRILALALRSVGCAGLMETHPLASAARDLMVYLRQPSPDAVLTRLGIAACDERYQALFDDR
jgi:alkylation response protein AidB-like acyl-CoA dehydrogenase